eukprot:TRINITY_DN12775_c0_g1_i3.p1 TRINITY_DN12775_c0_g1~~TRINITY_DN12775_c0_g1_i3.p1  ORF type:complete len:290 (+),score=43.37 TRINITY_DN12775_c0_g1_i3:62-871(+)
MCIRDRSDPIPTTPLPITPLTPINYFKCNEEADEHMPFGPEENRDNHSLDPKTSMDSNFYDSRVLQVNKKEAQGQFVLPIAKRLKKLEQNKELTRKSRARQRIYVSMLKQKMKQLTHEKMYTLGLLGHSTSDLKDCHEMLKTLAELNFQKRQGVFDIESALQNDESEESIKARVNTVLETVGLGSETRAKALALLLHELSRLVLPLPIVHLMRSMREKKGLFPPVIDDRDPNKAVLERTLKEIGSNVSHISSVIANAPAVYSIASEIEA